MFELEMNGQVYQFKFGMGFLREVNKMTTIPVKKIPGKEMNIGMPDHNSIVAGSALVLILVYEYFMSKHDLLEALGRQPAAVRWSIYYLLAIILFTLGQFNSDSFIYLQF